MAIIAQTDLFGNPVKPALKHKGRSKVNPCIPIWGTGPEGAKCGGCKHHYFREFARNYPKCGMRGDTGSASTDHSSRYPACGKYEPKSE